MSVQVRRFDATETALWAELRGRLWPGTEARELERILASDQVYLGWGAWEEGQPVGFAEASLRPFANGCLGSPVPFLEGIWVARDARAKGVGARLVAACEAWAREGGYGELGSDAELTNQIALQAHQAWGFKETERVIYLRKVLA